MRLKVWQGWRRRTKREHWSGGPFPSVDGALRVMLLMPASFCRRPKLPTSPVRRWRSTVAGRLAVSASPQQRSAGRQRAGEARHDAAQLIQIRLTQIAPHLVRPRVLGKTDRAQSSAATRRDADQLRSLVPRIVLILSEPVGFEQIGHSLNALTGQAKLPCDLGDGRRLGLNHLERKPASQCLATSRGDCLAGAAEMSLQLDHRNDQLG